MGQWHCGAPFSAAKEVAYVADLLAQSGVTMTAAQRELLAVCPACKREATVERDDHSQHLSPEAEK